MMGNNEEHLNLYEVFENCFNKIAYRRGKFSVFYSMGDITITPEQLLFIFCFCFVLFSSGSENFCLPGVQLNTF